MKLQEAIEILEPEVERWERTKIWHNPPFHYGTIKITTKELHALSVLFDKCIYPREKSNV